MCSPGCFSLFRAKALMDDNVMRRFETKLMLHNVYLFLWEFSFARYTTKSEEPRHYVQYDQGEDR